MASAGLPEKKKQHPEIPLYLNVVGSKLRRGLQLGNRKVRPLLVDITLRLLKVNSRPSLGRDLCRRCARSCGDEYEGCSNQAGPGRHGIHYRSRDTAYAGIRKETATNRRLFWVEFQFQLEGNAPAQLQITASDRRAAEYSIAGDWRARAAAA